LLYLLSSVCLFSLFMREEATDNSKSKQVPRKKKPRTITRRTRTRT
jgi:hypothetical protein